ncbi:hypothetical protein NAS2_0486 [Conexivisphaera calida]|uniref:Uncharacterized protein n=1 Tax=Conexivisphaera calida TaxID=1874277 RepID=A0A4P2VKZ9_9ARCH|nr:hypothetical protein NAS2_0486 [Conexivisphaera calida]
MDLGHVHEEVGRELEDEIFTQRPSKDRTWPFEHPFNSSPLALGCDGSLV